MFRSNKLNLIISIVAAVAIWVYVITFINPSTEKTIKDVPVTLTNVELLSESGLTVSPTHAFTVDVTVKGARSELNEITASDLTASSDMTGFPAGINTVDVEVIAPEGIDVADVRPAKIEVTVEELVSVTKPILLEYTDRFEQGSEPGFITVSPREISVSGTREIVDNIDSVKAVIDSSLLSDKEKTLTTKVEAYTKTGDMAYGVTLSQSEVDVTTRICRTKEVPLRIDVSGKPQAGRAITNLDIPKTVTVRGSADVIGKINEVTAPNIDIEGIKETTVFTPDLQLPPDVELADVSQGLTVTVEIGGIEAKNFLLTPENIAISGLPKGYAANISTASISVTVYGTHAQIESLKGRDLNAFIDLSKSDLSSATLDVKLNFDMRGKFKKIECIPQTVKVSLIKTSMLSANQLSSE